MQRFRHLILLSTMFVTMFQLIVLTASAAVTISNVKVNPVSPWGRLGSTTTLAEPCLRIRQNIRSM